MLLAIPAGIFARRRERPFYVGFALLSSGYLVLAYASWFEATIGRQLLAMRMAEWACVAVADSLGDNQHFVKATQALFTLGLAVAGGVLTDRWFKHAIDIQCRFSTCLVVKMNHFTQALRPLGEHDD